MKKTVSLLLALALIVMAFAGCAAQPKRRGRYHPYRRPEGTDLDGT